MKFKNKEIIEIINAINSLAEKDMPITLTYFIINNHKKLIEAYDVYNRARVKAKDQDELMKLLDIEVDVDVELINKQDLIEANLTLTPQQLLSLQRLIYG